MATQADEEQLVRLLAGSGASAADASVIKVGSEALTTNSLTPHVEIVETDHLLACRMPLSATMQLL